MSEAIEDVEVDDEGVWVEEEGCEEYSCDYYHPDGHRFLVARREDGREAALHGIDTFIDSLKRARAEVEKWCEEHDIVTTVEESAPKYQYLNHLDLPTHAKVVITESRCSACGLVERRTVDSIKTCLSAAKVEGVWHVCTLPTGHDGDHVGESSERITNYFLDRELMIDMMARKANG